MILLHVIIALVSLAFTTYLYVVPSKQKMVVSTGLIVATLGTGTYLVLANPAHMVESCVMGLGYLAVVLVGMTAAGRKLAKVPTR